MDNLQSIAGRRTGVLLLTLFVLNAFFAETTCATPIGGRRIAKSALHHHSALRDRRATDDDNKHDAEYYRLSGEVIHYRQPNSGPPLPGSVCVGECGGADEPENRRLTKTPAGTSSVTYSKHFDRTALSPVSSPEDQKVTRKAGPEVVGEEPPQSVVTPSDSTSNMYAGLGKVSKALYDYAAADDDEISFMKDDVIIHSEPIDSGWMTGVNQRTGEQGMLPSNYVEKLNW